MIASCFATAASAASPVPIIYCSGQGAVILNKDGEVVYDGDRVPLPDGLTEEMTKECVPLFALALVTDDWSAFRETALGYVTQIYEEVRLDENGEASNGSHRSWTWNPSRVSNGYTLGSYQFYQDWRLDPFENAAELNAYVQAVKAKTGSSKVNLVGRCEGANLVLAYLAEYGYDDVNCVEFYVSSALGVDTVGAVFSGEVKFEPQALQNLYNEKVTVEDNELRVLLKATIDYLAVAYEFEEICAMLEKAVPKLYKEVGYDILMASYGTFPGIWSCVGNDYYATARKNAFAGKEEQYAGLIEKLDKYDRLVRTRTDEIIEEGMAAGVKFANFAKYGEFYPNTPLCKENNSLNDDSVSIPCSTFGATSTVRNEQFSAEYLAKADNTYISPDKRIDMSTSVLRDTTWIEYNSRHNDFNQATNVLMKAWFDSNGEMTVHSDSAFPQYLVVENGAFRPMTASDVPEITSEKPTKVSRIFTVLQKFLEFFRNLFSFLSKKAQ